MNKLVALSDIKYDLLKIIEPYDGRLSRNEWRPVDRLFTNYLFDLKRDRAIRDFNSTYTIKEGTIIYDVGIKLSNDRSPKKLKIYVSTYNHPWVSK